MKTPIAFPRFPESARMPEAGSGAAVRRQIVGKILFIDAGSRGDRRDALELAGRICGPSWIAAAADLAAADFEGVSAVAIGGTLDGPEPAALAAAAARFAPAIAALPYALYSTRCASADCLASARAALAEAVGADAALVLDLGSSPAGGGAALRALRDERAPAPLPRPELMARVEAFLAGHRTCALATVSPEGSPRSTPIEYLWNEGSFLIFSEGGLKFSGLAEGAIVSLCVYDEYASMATVKGLQATGRAHLVPDGSDEWKRAFAARRVDPEALAQHRLRLNLFRVRPESFELLDASLRGAGKDTRQVLRVD
jgi:hypothetical protein